jgi:putative salt-induced outer membrane protein YdiY
MQLLSIRSLTFATVTTLALLSHDASAQAKPDSVKPLKMTAGVAYLDASGNTNVTSLTVSERLEWKRPRFVWTQAASAINGSTDGEESANLLAIGVRGDWKPRGRLSVYSLVNYDRNRFANIGRRFEEGAGLGYTMIERAHHRLTAELGSQFVQQRNLEKESDSFLAGRAAELYRYTIKADTYFEERVEFLPNLETNEDYRVNAEANLVAPVSRHLALKLGYVVRFDNRPEADVKKTDRFFTSGLQVSF